MSGPRLWVATIEHSGLISGEDPRGERKASGCVGRAAGELPCVVGALTPVPLRTVVRLSRHPDPRVSCW